MSFNINARTVNGARVTRKVNRKWMFNVISNQQNVINQFSEHSQQLIGEYKKALETQQSLEGTIAMLKNQIMELRSEAATHENAKVPMFVPSKLKPQLKDVSRDQPLAVDNCDSPVELHCGPGGDNRLVP